MTRGGGRHTDLTPDFVDEVAVARVLAGQSPGRALHRAERLAVARELVSRGENAATVAERTGCNYTEARRLVDQVKADTAE